MRLARAMASLRCRLSRSSDLPTKPQRKSCEPSPVQQTCAPRCHPSETTCGRRLRIDEPTDDSGPPQARCVARRHGRRRHDDDGRHSSLGRKGAVSRSARSPSSARSVSASGPIDPNPKIRSSCRSPRSTTSSSAAGTSFPDDALRGGGAREGPRGAPSRRGPRGALRHQADEGVFDQSFLPPRLRARIARGEPHEAQGAVEQVRSDLRAFKKGERRRPSRRRLVAPRDVRLTGARHPGAWVRSRRGSRTTLHLADADLRVGVSEGHPFANGRANLKRRLRGGGSSRARRTPPIAGKDFKTGQTLMKTVIAPGLKARMIRLRGWYSTNILGNRDGVRGPSMRPREATKLGVLDSILEPDAHPGSRALPRRRPQGSHRLLPAARRRKEGWDNIDIEGWLGIPGCSSR